MPPQEAVDRQYKYLATLCLVMTTLSLLEEVGGVELPAYNETACWLAEVVEEAFWVPIRLVESTIAEVWVALNRLEVQGAPLVWLDLLLV